MFNSRAPGSLVTCGKEQGYSFLGTGTGCAAGSKEARSVSAALWHSGQGTGHLHPPCIPERAPPGWARTPNSQPSSLTRKEKTAQKMQTRTQPRPRRSWLCRIPAQPGKQGGGTEAAAATKTRRWILTTGQQKTSRIYPPKSFKSLSTDVSPSTAS